MGQYERPVPDGRLSWNHRIFRFRIHAFARDNNCGTIDHLEYRRHDSRRLQQFSFARLLCIAISEVGAAVRCHSKFCASRKFGDTYGNDYAANDSGVEAIGASLDVLRVFASSDWSNVAQNEMWLGASNQPNVARSSLGRAAHQWFRVSNRLWRE